MWKSLTGRDLYHACEDQCLNYSQPCKEKCMPGAYRHILCDFNVFNLILIFVVIVVMSRLLAVSHKDWMHPFQHQAAGGQHVQPLWRQAGLCWQIRWGLAGVSSGQSQILREMSLNTFHKRFLTSTCQVYSSDVTSVAVLFTLLLLAIFLFIYIIKQQILVIKFYGKSKLLEMHMSSVHQIEIKWKIACLIHLNSIATKICFFLIHLFIIHE